MKLNPIGMLGIVALLIGGCATEVSSNQGVQETQPTAPMSNPVAESADTSGTFKAAEHPTQGMVRVVTDNGKRYLEFDQNFKTDKGPDLFVILHRSEAPPISGVKEEDYLTIGPLQNVSGTQRYALPDDANLAEFGSVAIWCRQFNATFGFAPLSA